MSDAARFTSVMVARPGQLWDKHRKFDFGIVLGYAEGASNFSKLPTYKVWIADTDEIRHVFWQDVHKYPRRRRKR